MREPLTSGGVDDDLPVSSPDLTALQGRYRAPVTALTAVGLVVGLTLMALLNRVQVEEGDGGGAAILAVGPLLTLYEVHRVHVLRSVRIAADGLHVRSSWGRWHRYGWEQVTSVRVPRLGTSTAATPDGAVQLPGLSHEVARPLQRALEDQRRAAAP